MPTEGDFGEEVVLGALVMVFAAEVRRRWRSWPVMAALIALVCGLVLSAAAAGRRTASAFPNFVAAHGFDAAVYGNQPLPTLRKLFPTVVSSTELVFLQDTGQPACACTHQINNSYFEVVIAGPGGPTPFKLLSGHLPDPSAPDQVLASFALQQDDGVRLGSVIRVPFYSMSQASAYNNATGAPPKPEGPTLAFHVVGLEASEAEFPTGSGPTYDLWGTQALARSMVPLTPPNYTYYVRLRHGPPTSTASILKLRQQSRYRTTKAPPLWTPWRRRSRPRSVPKRWVGGC